MSMTPSSRRAAPYRRTFASLALLIGLILPLVSGQARADAVVIRSTVADVKPGQVFTDGATITLPAGATILLVAQDGRTITLTGPFSGPPTADIPAGDNHAVNALSRLFTASAGDTSSLGVTRGVGLSSKDPYAIAAVTGTHCQVADHKPVLKRGMGLSPAHGTITSASGQTGPVDWVAGSLQAEWPANLTLEDNAAFQIQVDGTPKPATVTVRMVPAGLAPDALVAAWMVDHGCDRQAHNLLATLK